MSTAGTTVLPPDPAPPVPPRRVTAVRWVQLVGFGLPALAIVGLELWLPGHLDQVESTVIDNLDAFVVLVVVSVAAICLFAAGMFTLIARSQRQVVEDSRQLAAVNAVIAAVRDARDVEAVVSAGRRTLMEVSSARDVEFEIWEPGSDAPEHPVGLPTRAAQLGCPDPTSCRCTHVPLLSGPDTIGWMRVEWSPEYAPEELPTSTLGVIGRQLGFAVHTRQVVAQLRQHETTSQALHDILMGISRQDPIASLLAMGVDRARTMAGADGAGIHVRTSVAESVHRGHEPELPTVFISGHTEADPTPRSGHGTAQPAARLVLPLVSQGETFGDLTVVRPAARPFTDGEREHLAALADVCATALGNARVRVDEQNVAIVDERQRIARELHDSLAQVLAFTHLRLRTVATSPAVSADPALLADLEQIADVCEDAYSDVREAILGLHHGGEKGRPFLSTLQAFMAKYSAQSGIGTTLQVDCDEQLHLTPHTELQTVRVIQEALTNARKHSGARHVTVRVAQEAASTLVEITDDGVGFDLASATAHHDGYGLTTMRERLALVGGSLAITSAPGRGTCVSARLPGGWQPPRTVTKVIDERPRSTHPHPPGR